MENEAKDKRICRECRVIKTRVGAGRYPNGKDTKWVDEHGKQWNGNMCPSCFKYRTRFKTKERRNEALVKKATE